MHLECYIPPKRHLILKSSTENKLLNFSKRALRAGAARNKWLSEALIRYCQEHSVILFILFNATLLILIRLRSKPNRWHYARLFERDNAVYR